MKNPIESINWKWLREQKADLVHRIWDDKGDDLWGLVELLDNIQDYAVDSGMATEIEVFGELQEIEAKYTSVWACGVSITTACKYDPEAHSIVHTEDVDIEGLDSLEDEFITLPNGDVLRNFEIED